MGLHAVTIARRSLAFNLSYFDVKALIEKKVVSRPWRQTCKESIDAKQAKTFSTYEELCQAVKKYCGDDDDHEATPSSNPQVAEAIAQTYGYPITKWDVSTPARLQFYLPLLLSLMRTFSHGMCPRLQP
jgi:hypothetical protein